MAAAPSGLGQGIMNGYFLGIDVGGTKCHALVADGTGRAVGFGHGGAGNPEVVGWDGLRAALHEVAELALSAAQLSKHDLCGAGFGVAGYDWPADLAPTRLAIESLALPEPFAVVNDATLGLLAGAREGWGVVISAGTSNNCRGQSAEGLEGRVTGNGPAFGENGGATEMVARAVQQVVKAWSRRGPGTVLAEGLVRAAGASGVADLLEGLARGRYRLSADDVALVFAAEAAGDPVARDLVRWAGRELGSLAIGVIRQLNLEALSFDVVLAGSLFGGSQRLTDALKRTIVEVAPHARLVRLEAPPVVGAVLLGMGAAGLVPGDGVRTTLIESAAALPKPGPGAGL